MAGTKKRRGRKPAAPPRKPRAPRFELPGGQSWADIVIGAVENLSPGMPISGGVTDLRTIYSTVGALIGEQPLSQNHRAKVRQVIGRTRGDAGTILPLGHARCTRKLDHDGNHNFDPDEEGRDPNRCRAVSVRYGRIRNPTTRDFIPAIINPETGRKQQEALPNQTVLDEIVGLVSATTDVIYSTYSAQRTPVGQGPTMRRAPYDFYDLELMEPPTPGVVEMEEMEQIMSDAGQFDRDAFGDAVAEACARLMVHGYAGTIRISLRVAQLVHVEDIWGRDTYYWDQGRGGSGPAWVTIVFGSNARVASGQIANELRREMIDLRSKYIKEGEATPIPIAISFIAQR